jgi:5-methylcytosine-specific restriction enzyme subunit McrC
LRSYATDRELPSDGNDLFDLLAWIFADACARIAAAGPRKDYVEREDELPVLRGRLLADRQLLRRPERPDRLWCRFDEHEHDVPDNQLLAAALRACSLRARHPKVRRRITNLLDLFLAICDPDALDLRTCGEFEYHRLNAHYRDAHGIAWALLDGLGIDDVLATRGARAFAFLLDMNRLFEQFVEGVVKQMMTGVRCRIHTQHHDGSVLRDGTTGRSYTTVIPDVFIESREPTARSLAIDAKYKLYDDRRIDRGDLYQAFVYAHAFGVEEGRLRRTVLVYPASDDTLSRETIRVHERAGAASAEVHAVGLPVMPILAELNGGPGGYLDRLRGCLW